MGKEIAGLAAMLALIAGAAASEGVSVSSKARVQLPDHQLRLLDGRAADQYSFSARLQPRADEAIPPFRGAPPPEYLRLARASAARHGVPPDLFLRLVSQESGWNSAAVSPKGAVGLAQLMPETARMLGVNPRDPRQNLDGGARYLAEQYRRFRTWRLALAAYNAGPEAVERHGGVPPFRETQGYVRAILGD